MDICKVYGYGYGYMKIAVGRPEKWTRPSRPKGKSFSTLELNSLKPGPRVYRLYGPGGLIIEVQPGGGKHWRWRYRRPDGRETMMPLGKYPEISLAVASERLADAKRTRALGQDPIQAKQAAAVDAGTTFEAVAREWLAFTSASRKPRSNAHIQGVLERDVFPHLGRMPIAAITAPHALPVFERMAARGVVHTARRALSYCVQIADFAQTEGQLLANPFPPISKRLPVEQVTHHAAITRPALVGQLLRAIEVDRGDVLVRAALRLAAMFFVRPVELRRMRWDGVHWEKREWHLLAVEKKEKREHIVPLCTQALAILQELRPITGNGEYVLAARGGLRPMSENTLNVALDRMGFGRGIHTAHGFRATAATLLDEELRFPIDIIEHQLAHTVRGPLGDTYNRTTKIEDRHRMMQAWGDYLEGLRNAATQGGQDGQG